MTVGTPFSIGSGGRAATSSNSFVITTTVDSPAGNAIIVLADWGSASGTISSVTDSAGNTYTGGTNRVNSGGVINRIFVCPNALHLPVGGTITANFSATASTSARTVAQSCANVATATPIDVNFADINSSATTAPSASTGTLAQADEVICVGITIASGTTDGFTQDADYTALDSGTVGGAVTILRTAYRVVSATTSDTYAPTLGTSRINTVVGVSLKGSSNPSGTLSVTIAAVTLVATGVLPVQAVASPTIAAVTSVATGALIQQGVLGATIDPVTLVAHGGLQPISGVTSAAIDPVVLSAASTVKLQAAASPTIDPVTLVATGTVKLQAAVGATIAAVTGTETGTLKIQGTLGVTIDAVTLSAASTIATTSVLQLGQNAAATGSTTLVITTGVDCPAGSGIIVAAGTSGGSAVSSVADSAGNTYTSLSSGTTAPGFRQFYSPNCAHLAAGGTITVTYASSTGEKAALAIAVPGLQLTSPLEQQSGVDHGTAAGPNNSLATLAQQREFLFAAEGILAGGADSWTEQAGWTAVTPATVGGATLIVRGAYQVSAVTTAPNYAPTGGPSRTYTGTFNTFKMQPFGVVTALIDPVTLSATGTVPGDTGVVSATIAPVTLVATATLTLQAVETSTIAAVTLSSAAAVKLQAVVAATIAAVTGTESGTLKIQAVVGATIDPVTLSSTGTNKLQAVVGATIDPVTLSATAHLAGSYLTVTIDPVTLVATAQLKVAGVAGGTIAPVTLSATAAVVARAVVGGTIAPVTLVATGIKSNRGVLAVSIGNVTILAHGGVQKLAVLNTTIGAITLSVGRAARRGHRGSLLFSGL